MVDVNVFRILAVTHSVLCLVIWQSYAHSANYSNATGRCLTVEPELPYWILFVFVIVLCQKMLCTLYCRTQRRTAAFMCRCR